MREIARGHTSTITPPHSHHTSHRAIPTSPSPPNPHSSTHEPVSACLLPWHVWLLINTHGVGLVILLRDGDVRVTNRSDALIFSKSQSGHANLMRSELGVVSTSEDLLLHEYIYSARSLKNMPNFAPLPLARYRCAKLSSGTGRASHALPRVFPLQPPHHPPSFPLLHNPPTQPTNHTHIPHFIPNIHHHNLTS